MWRRRLAENTGRKKSPKLPSGHHCTTLSGYIFTIKACVDNQKKSLLHSSISATCLPQYGELCPTNGWDLLVSLGTPANFNRFRILASLLQRRRSTEVNKTLHDVWPSPALVHYVYIFGGSCTLTEFCQLQNSLGVEVLRSPVLAALLHGSGREPNFVAWYKEWNYITFAEGATYIRLGGHHVRWASAHILVELFFPHQGHMYE